MPKTLYDKIWDDHLVHQQTDGTSLLYVDRHLVSFEQHRSTVTIKQITENPNACPL